MEYRKFGYVLSYDDGMHRFVYDLDNITLTGIHVTPVYVPLYAEHDYAAITAWQCPAITDEEINQLKGSWK